MPFDIKAFRDQNAAWYGEDPLDNVAKDIYDRGDENIRRGMDYDTWKKKTGIQDQIDRDLEESKKLAEEKEKSAYFASRGPLESVAGDIAGGVVDYGQLGMRALRTLTPEDSEARGSLTAGIEGIDRFKERTPFLQEDPANGYFSRSLHGGIRSAVQSITAGLPGAAAGAMLGTPAGPVGTAVGAVLGYATSGALQFGLTQYDDVMERGLKEGIPRDRLEPAAIRSALYEGGFEFATDIIQGMTMGAGTLVTAPGRAAVKATIKDMLGVSFKEFAKRSAKVGALEVGSEVLTAGAQAEEERAIGLGDQRFWQASVEAFGPSVVASMIFAGVFHANTKLGQRRIRKALENPEANPELRAQAADEVYAALQEYDPLVADTWGQTAYDAIRKGESISTDDNILEMQDRIQALRKDPSPQAQQEANALQDQLRKMFTEEHKKPLPTSKSDLELERGYAEGLERVLGPEDAEARKSVAQRKGQIDQALEAEEDYEIRREQLRRQGPTIAPPAKDEPWSPEFARRAKRDKETPALPAPSRDFEMRRPEDVYSPYSPDVAEQMKPGAKALPPGQGFDLRGEPEDVAAPYSPEMADALKRPKTGLPEGQGFELKEGETPEQRIEQLDNRIKNLTSHANLISKQINRVENPRRREKLQVRLDKLNTQIEQNRKQKAVLEARTEPVPDKAPEKSARESADAFAKEAGRVQSPVGKELLQRKLFEEEKEGRRYAAGGMRPPIPPRTQTGKPLLKQEPGRPALPPRVESGKPLLKREISRPPLPARTAREIDEAAHGAATSPRNDIPEPTDAQKEAGNYAKGHINLHGLDISIENPKGSERKGVSPEGKPWSTKMNQHYGYIKGTVGKDKDHLDVFIGENPDSPDVYVVDQVNPKTGKFDEHKVMMGFEDEASAREAYLSNYEKDWKGLRAVTRMPMEEFKTWAKSDDPKKGALVKTARDSDQFKPAEPKEEPKKAEPRPPMSISNPDAKLRHKPGYSERVTRRAGSTNEKGEQQPDTLVRVSGKPVTIEGLEDLDLFVYYNRDEGFFVVDGRSGYSLNYQGGRDEKHAISNFKNETSGHSPEQVRKDILATDPIRPEDTGKSDKFIPPALTVSTWIRDRILESAGPSLIERTEGESDPQILQILTRHAESAHKEYIKQFVTGKQVPDNVVDYLGDFKADQFAQGVLNYARRKGLIKKEEPAEKQAPKLKTFTKDNLSPTGIWLAQYLTDKPQTSEQLADASGLSTEGFNRLRTINEALDELILWQVARVDRNPRWPSPTKGYVRGERPVDFSGIEFPSSPQNPKPVEKESAEKKSVNDASADDILAEIRKQVAEREGKKEEPKPEKVQVEGLPKGYTIEKTKLRGYYQPYFGAKRVGQAFESKEDAIQWIRENNEAREEEKRRAAEDKAAIDAAMRETNREINRRQESASKPKATEKLKDAGDHLKAIKDGIKKINAIFGERGSFSTEPLDESIHEQIRPILKEMWDHAVAAGQDLKEFVSLVLDELSVKAAPYFERFIQEEFSDAGKKPGTDKETGGGDRSPLEGAPPRDDSEAGGEGEPGKGGDGSRGRSPESDGEVDESGDSLGPGVGDDEGGVPVSSGGRGRGGRGGGTGKRGQLPSDDAGADSTETDRQEPGGGVNSPRNDYKISNLTHLGEGGPKIKFRNNVAAVKLINELEETGRDATEEEQHVLARYVGWGGLPQAFDPLNNDWSREYQQLKELLSEDEWNAAFESTQYAHFTSRAVVDGVYSALRKMGFSGGIILEPGCGTGNFIGLTPSDIKTGSRFTGVERERISARIAQHLYPNQNIQLRDFREFTAANGHFDAVIGNPPFGKTSLTDKSGRKHLTGLSIHNYFIAKSVDLAREGGIIAVVVSRYYMDAKRSPGRDYVADRTRFLGAMRLPNTAFLSTAGTEVTTDIIFLQKLAEKDYGSMATRKHAKETWNSVVDIPDPLGGTDIKTNIHYQNHPQMLLGSWERSGTMRQSGDPTLRANPEVSLEDAIRDAIRMLPENAYTPRAKQMEDALRDRTVEAMKNLPVEVGGYFLKDGKLYQRMPDVAGETFVAHITSNSPYSESQVLGVTRYDKLVRLASLRQTIRSLLAAEMQDNESEMKKLRKELNRIYDEFVKKHGYINASSTARLINEDPDAPLLLALELDYDPGLGADAAKRRGVDPSPPTAKKHSIFTTRGVPKKEEITTANTPEDALLISVAEHGRIDAAYIGKLLGKDGEGVLKELAEQSDPLLFVDPATQGYVLRDEYLSGNVRRKLREAEQAGMVKNMEALKKVQPPEIPPHEITGRIGAPWIPTEVYEDFIRSLMGEDSIVNVDYFPVDSSFSLTGDNWDDIAETNLYGIPQYPASRILYQLLNNKQIRATSPGPDGRAVFDEELTREANDKAKEIKDRFNDWLFRDDLRSERLVEAYNHHNNNYVTRTYDGSWLTLPGKVPDSVIKLRRHQMNAVARIIQSRTALLDHVVGAGKTYVMIASIMEMRRMGIAKKPMITVPNHLVGQWAADFYRLYPGARILAATEKDFARENRRKFLAKAAMGDYDAIIVAHTSFGFIKPDPAFEEEFTSKQVQSVRQAIEELMPEAGTGKRPANAEERAARRTIKQLAALLEKLENRIAKLREKPIDDIVDLAEIGVDQLFVDEAHMYKNLMYHTKIQDVAGMNNPTGSQRAWDMYIKTQQIMNKNGKDQGVVFATGTPVSNSLAEMYHMMRYMAPSEMSALGFDAFDAWANTFAAVEGVWVQSLSGSGLKLKDRLSRFVNAQNLLKIYDLFADTITNANMQAAHLVDFGEEFPIPKIKGGGRQAVSIPRSKSQARYMKDIARRAEEIKGRGRALPGEDNALTILMDGRKAAMDMRLVNPDFTERNPEGRVAVVARNAVDTYRRYDHVKGTQLIFCDMGVPIKHVKKELEEHEKLISKAKMLEDEDLVAAADLGNEAAMAKIREAEDAAAKIEAKGPDWLVGIKAAQRGFSVYDDLRAAMVEQGIPENEIAFIHDANTRDRKVALFKAMNKGTVRVLIGSTEKMGAGTNVQERLVALHHVDCPWRPSDIEQREGRIIRQGNKLREQIPDFEVEISAYATQDMFDLFMWQTQGEKLRVIEQIRNRQVGNVVEDVFGDMNMSVEAMQAAATSNPYFMEEIQLRQAIQDLERKKRGHESAQNEMKRKARASERTVNEAPKMIEVREAVKEATEGYERKLLKRQEGLSVEINGKVFKANTEGGQYTSPSAILAEAEKLLGDLVAIPELDPADIPTLIQIEGKQFSNLKEAMDAFAAIIDEPDASNERELRIGYGKPGKSYWLGDLKNVFLRYTAAGQELQKLVDKDVDEHKKKTKPPPIDVTFNGEKYTSRTKLSDAYRAAVGDASPIIIEVNGFEHNRRSRAVNALLETVREMDESGERTHLFNLGEMKVFATTNLKKNSVSIDMEVGGHTPRSIDSTYARQTDNEGNVFQINPRLVGENILSKVERFLRNNDYYLRTLRESLEDARKKLKTLKDQDLDQEWAGEEELREARERYREVLNAITQMDQERQERRERGERESDEADDEEVLFFSRTLEAKPKPGPTPAEQIHRQIVDRVKHLSSGWTGVKVSTVKSFTDLPSDVASGVINSIIPDGTQDEEFERLFSMLLKRTEGFYNPNDKTIYIISENCRTAYRAEEVLLHEAVGHHGVRTLLGNQYRLFLNEVAAFYGRAGLADIARLYQLDLNTKQGREKAADEKIARLAEKNERPGLFRRIISAFRRALRRMGFSIKLSENDIKALLMLSERALGNERGGAKLHYAPAVALMSKSELIGDDGYNLDRFPGRVSQYTSSSWVAKATAEYLEWQNPASKPEILEPYPGLFEVQWTSIPRERLNTPVNYPKRKGRKWGFFDQETDKAAQPGAQLREAQKEAPEYIETEQGRRKQKDVDEEFVQKARAELEAMKQKKVEKLQKGSLSLRSERDNTQYVEPFSSPQQKISSAATSINEGVLPKTFTSKPFLDALSGYLRSGEVNILDVGAGKFDNAKVLFEGGTPRNLSPQAAEKYERTILPVRKAGSVKYHAYDPFNRPESENMAAKRATENGQADIVVSNNVLNVIREYGARQGVYSTVANALSPDGTAFFLVYSSFGDNVGTQTSTKDRVTGEKTTSWQNRVGPHAYMGEIGRYFRSVRLVGGGIIEARHPVKTKREVIARPINEYSGWPVSTGKFRNGREILSNYSGSTISRGDATYPIGKVVGTQVYFHKDYLGKMPDVVKRRVRAAMQKLPGGFQYNTLMYDKGDGRVRFDEAPDFDTAREPIPGKMFSVYPDGRTKLDSKTGDQIWHHKWQWVGEDYKGFDVAASYEWSREYLGKLIGMPNGRPEIWRQQLRDHGLMGGGIARNTEAQPIALSLSLSASDALDSIQAQPQKQPKATLQVTFGRHEDLRELRDSFRIPAWLSKTNATVKRFFERQNQRDKDRSTIYHSLLERSKAAFDLKGKPLDDLAALAFRLENKKIVDVSAFKRAGSRTLVKGPAREEVVVPVYVLNQEHYEKLREHLRTEKVSDEVAEAYLGVRQALDESLLVTLDRLTEIKDLDPTLIEKYRAEMGRINNYIPHNRYGNHFIRAINPESKSGEESLYRMHFNAANERHARWWYAKNIDRIIAELEKSLPETKWKDLKWEVGRNQQLPEEVYDYPLPIDAMQQIIDSAVANMPEDAGTRETLRRELSREISDVLKSRGFGSHMIKRKDVPGHETKDILRVVNDHFAGFSGWLTKMEAAHDFGNYLRKVDAKEKPNEYKWAVKFTNDMLQNATQLDRVVDAARSFFFIKYLGANIKTAAVNLTQNLVAGVPRLAMDVGGAGAAKAFLKAANDVKTAVTKKGLEPTGKGRFSDAERRLLQDMFAEGWGQANLVAEMRGKVGGPFQRQFGKAARLMGLPMELAERYNRLSLGLAAFRAATEGKITNEKTLLQLGLQAGQPAPYQKAKDFAETVVNDSHFIYGKGNRPAVFRGGAASKLASTAYTFRTFSHNLVSMWRWMLTEGGNEGRIAFSYSLLAMISLGGVGAVPLYEALAALLRQLLGEDPLGLGLRKATPKPFRDIVMYGAPSILGVDIGGSIAMEIPIADRVKVNQPLSGQLGQGIGELLGIPFAVLEDLTKTVDAIKAGRPDRAAEYAAPTFLRNILSSVRLATEGQASISGKPINVPGEKGPRKISGAEAIAKGLGFQPLSSSKAFDIHRSLEEVKGYRNEKQEELANRYIAAERARDSRELLRIREEAQLWNRRAIQSNRPEIKIDLDKAVRSRRQARQPMKSMKGLARDYRENFEM